MKVKLKYLALSSGLALGVLASAQATDKKPNIITIISYDFGYGDAGCYGGG